MASHPFADTQVRVVRPARNFEAVWSFYEETLGLSVIASFEGHAGHDGVIFGLPDASRQLELMRATEPTPTPTTDDQLVFYLASSERVAEVAGRIAAAGHEPVISTNPYWEDNGAVCFVDPDGYWLILSPQTW